ncbi:MAG TPA: hypothetical protein EYH16_04760 [Leucothrix mucor]|nr:hypothetical protein [Leucothrix mucor]
MNIKTISALVLAGVCSVSVSSLSAANFSYNYVEAGIAKVDADGAENTYGIDGSYGVTPNVNLLGSYSTTEAGDIDVSGFSLGAGYHAPISPSTDFVGEVSYINIEADGVEDQSGYGLNAGVRHKVSPEIEANASINFVDIEDKDDTSFTVGGRYYFNQQFSAGLGYETGDDGTVFGTLRMDF